MCDTVQSAMIVVVLCILSLVSVVTAACPGCKVDLCFVVDDSGSISSIHWYHMKTFMHELVSGMEIGPLYTRIGMVKLDFTGKLIFDLDDHSTKSEVLTAIDSIVQTGAFSDVAASIDVARTQCFGPGHGDRENVANVMILITDGWWSVDPQNAIGRARADGIALLAIGVSDSPNYELYWTIGYMETFMVGTPHRPPLTAPYIYTYHTVVPAVSDRYLTFCYDDCKVDLCFVVDESGSNTDWANVKGFIYNLIMGMDIGPTSTRVGLVEFDGIGHLMFYLDTYLGPYYDKKSTLLAAIDGMSQSFGGSNIEAGINLARTDCFNSGHGDREDAQNVMIVITDGWTSSDAAGAANAARDDGIAVIAIGFHGYGNPNMATISAIAGGVQEYIFNVDDTIPADYNYDTLVPAVASLYHTFCHSLCMADVCFVVDKTGSASEWPKIKQLMTDFVSSHVIGLASTLVGVVGFDTGGQLLFNLVEHVSDNDLEVAINGMIQSGPGAGNVADGINVARAACFGPGSGARTNARDVMVVITDGGNCKSCAETAADAARADGITVIAIGVDDPEASTIEAIAGMTTYSFYAGYFTVMTTEGYFTQDYSTLEDEVSNLYGDLCSKLCVVDMCFVVDETRYYLNDVDFTHVKEVMTRFVDAIEIGDHDNLVGVLGFDLGGTYPYFDLNDHMSKADVITGIAAVTRHNGEDSDIGIGIQAARRYCFGSGSGDRPFAPNVMFVVADEDERYDDALAISEANAARADGTTVFLLGLYSTHTEWSTVLGITAYEEENRIVTKISYAPGPHTWETTVADLVAWYHKHWCCKLYCKAREPPTSAYPLSDLDDNPVTLPDDKVTLLAYNPKPRTDCKLKVTWDRKPTAKPNKWMAINVAKDPDRSQWYYRKVQFPGEPNTATDEPRLSGWKCTSSDQSSCPSVVSWPTPPWYPYDITSAVSSQLVYARLSRDAGAKQYDVKIWPTNVAGNCPGLGDNPGYHLSYFYDPDPEGVRMQLALDGSFYKKHRADLTGYCVPA